MEVNFLRPPKPVISSSQIIILAISLSIFFILRQEKTCLIIISQVFNDFHIVIELHIMCYLGGNILLAQRDLNSKDALYSW